MKSRWVWSASPFIVAVVLWPVWGAAWTTPLRVLQDHVYRLGVFLAVEGIVENVSTRRVDRAEVSVEFYNFFDELVSAEYTVLRPPTLGPGQKGTLRVVTPYSDAVRKIRYRFTWRENHVQFQSRPEEGSPRWR